jgi:hypothetical protein
MVDEYTFKPKQWCRGMQERHEQFVRALGYNFPDFLQKAVVGCNSKALCN